MMISTIAALSTFYHDAKDIFSAEIAQEADLPPCRESSDHCGVLLSPHFSACRSYIRTMNSAIRAISQYAFPHQRSQNTGNPNPTLERALDDSLKFFMRTT